MDKLDTLLNSICFEEQLIGNALTIYYDLLNINQQMVGMHQNHN